MGEIVVKKETGTGSFYLPTIYRHAQREVEKNLIEGEIDYADLSFWSFPDEFFCFLLERKLFRFLDQTYPNPRIKNEIPVWFLVSCQLVMRLYQTGKYHHLRYLLNSGSILTRFGFNVGSQGKGFNEKNKKAREAIIDADSVRKFFKDTKPDAIRDWYHGDCQRWFHSQHAFGQHGLFILDQSHLVVPDNENYSGAVKMPVDEHGQLYRHLPSLTKEQKKALPYHRCYTFSTLLNVEVAQDLFHVAGYELGPGNEDELVQAERLLDSFCRQFPGTIKTLIVDRGYIDGEFIHKLKQTYSIDVLVPLRKNMTAYIDAVTLAKLENKWETIELQVNKQEQVMLKKEIACVPDIELWEPLKLHALVTRYTSLNEHNDGYDEHYAVLVSTKKYTAPKQMVTHYDLRVSIEERFRQFKRSWHITEFPSPHASLVESHVCFTLLTYSLLQLYLRRKEFQAQTHQLMDSLRRDEQLGKNAVVVYAKNNYAVFDLDDYTIRIAGMNETPRQRLIALMEKQKKDRIEKQKI